MGSYAFVVVEDDKALYEYSRRITDTTNNRCELQAITDAIRWVEEQGITEPVRLFSDSEYCVKGLNHWRHGWRKTGFAGKKNPDMWEALDELATRNNHVQFTWVKGHSNNKWNNRCDELCTTAMNKQSVGEKLNQLSGGESSQWSEKATARKVLRKELKKSATDMMDLYDRIDKAEELLYEVWCFLDHHWPGSHGLKGKIGEFLNKTKEI